MGHMVSCYRLKQQIGEHNVVVDMQTSALGKREQHIDEKNIEMQRRETGANRFPADVVNFFSPLEKIDNAAMVDQHALGPAGPEAAPVNLHPGRGRNPLLRSPAECALSLPSEVSGPAGEDRLRPFPADLPRL